MPTPSSTLSRLSAFFKTVYIDKADSMRNAQLRDRPLLRMMNQIDDLDGASLYSPLNVVLPGGFSASFTNARANRTGSKGYGWTLSRNTAYQFVSISGEAIHASRRDPAAFIRAKAKETKEAVEYIMNRLGEIAWNDGSADIGRIASSTGTTTRVVQLADTSRAINFAEGQVCIANTVRGLAAGTTRTGVGTVTAVNMYTGVVTFTLTVSDWADDDYIFIQGDRDTAAGLAQVGKGIQAYIPASDPGVGTVPIALNGITDRSVNPTALAGWRSSWEGSIEESAKKLATTMLRHTNQGATVYWLSYDNWHRLEMEMGARAVRDVGMPAKFGFPTIGLSTAKGIVPVAADPFCPNDAGFLLDMSTWDLHTLEGLPHVITDDGQSMLRETDADGVEVRFRAWYEFCCNRPMANGRHPIT